MFNFVNVKIMFKWLKDEYLFWKNIRQIKKNTRMMKEYAKYSAEKAKCDMSLSQKEFYDRMFKMLEPQKPFEFDLTKQLLDMMIQNGKSKSKGKGDSKKSAKSTGNNC